MTLTAAAALSAQDACQSDGFARLLEALRLPQGPRTVNEVFEAAATALPVLGFRHSLVTRVVDDRWEQVVPAGSCHEGWTPPDWPRPGKPWNSKTSSAPSYAATPVAPDGSVLGVLFADQAVGIGPVDEVHRDLLTLFAMGTGCALQRAALAERIDLLRNTLNDPNPSSTSTPDSGRGAPADRETSGTRAAAFDRFAKIEEPLTRRERDVMELVARGDTNTQVARRLVMSEGTVKWHMKNILRKLGAPNRAAAVSAWLSESAS
jgi:DNA-binding CsgD family transcriptional regulator